MKPTDTRDILLRIRAFPPLPASATVVLQALADEDADASAVENAVRYDPGLTANVLRFANSAHFGTAGGIDSVREAIVRLGRRKIMDLVVAASLSTRLSGEVAGYALPPGSLWEHSVAVAVAAERIEARLGARAEDSVFTAAILHDVGMLVLDEFVGRRIKDIDSALGAGRSFDRAERAATGLDHAEVGGRVLGSWSFPRNLVLAARYHHRPDDLDEPHRTVDVIHVADGLARMIGFGSGVEGLSYRISKRVEERLGLDSAALEEAAAETLQGVQELDFAPPPAA